MGWGGVIGSVTIKTVCAVQVWYQIRSSRLRLMRPPLN